MFRRISFVSLIFITRLAFGQNLVFEYDTLSHRHSTLGDLDTFDRSSILFSSSFLFTNESKNVYTVQPYQLFHPGSSIYSFEKTIDKTLIFSALPHIGFGYSFGGQATQKLDFDYQQAFKHSFLINAAIHNFKTAGFFRNTMAQNSLYELALARNGKKHSFQLLANSSKVQRNWNGGIQNDSLVETFSPDLIPVWKENAQSIHKNLNIQLTNKFSFVSDSMNQFGLTTTNKYNRFKRFYTEQDDISLLYPNVNLDSSKTSDSLLQQNLINNIGLFFKSSRFSIEAGCTSHYWNFRSFEFLNDTLELGIYSQVGLKFNNFTFNQKGNFNLFGAANGIYNFMEVKGKLSSFDLNFSHEISNELPIVFQRFFYSNNISYKTTNIENQWFQDFKVQVARNFGKQTVELTYKFGQFNKVYQYDLQQQIWRNNLNSSKGIYQQFSLKSNLNWRWLHGHLNYQFTAIDENIRFTPAHLLDTRLFVKGGIFKAKKLKALAGVDFLIASSYKRLNFIPQMTVFDVENSSLNPNSSGFMNLAAFASFEVEAFRLFFRMDNIAYFWQNRQIELVKGYAFPSTQLKVGITWDFWN